MICLRDLSSSSAGNDGSSSCSASRSSSRGKSSVRLRPLKLKYSRLDENPSSIPAFSLVAASSSLLRRPVPLLSIDTTRLPSPGRPGGSSILPAHTSPCMLTVVLLWFSWTTTVSPLASCSAVTAPAASPPAAAGFPLPGTESAR